MNLSVGGLNSVREHIVHLIWGQRWSGCQPFMPEIRLSMYVLTNFQKEKPRIRLLDEDGNLKPEVLEILELVKSYNATVAATGHISLGESVAVIVMAKHERWASKPC